MVVDSRRDFFLRLSSFSLALGNDADRQGWRRLRHELQQEMPWLPEEALDLRSNKEIFKDNVARAVCCALPVFDLVIVDEGHNLKHGFRAGVAARNSRRVEGSVRKAPSRVRASAQVPSTTRHATCSLGPCRRRSRDQCVTVL